MKEPERETLKSLLDLTSLEGTDNRGSILTLCEKARRLKVAGVCVFPAMIRYVKEGLTGTGIRSVSVAGAFPSGQLPLNLRLKEAEFALKEGADEIDMVISRGIFLSGNREFLKEEVSAFKKICGNKTLKVILETGELRTEENIRLASELAIEAGADFLKTSTGKIPSGATPEAVRVMLKCIRESGKPAGIKPSGGIADPEPAMVYIRLVKEILGDEAVCPERLRFGASRLADRL